MQHLRQHQRMLVNKLIRVHSKHHHRPGQTVMGRVASPARGPPAHDE